jgi:RNA polymerase sigma factor (sigma-70 family)
VYENDYGSTVERWKVALIRRLAKRRGFRPDELSDVQQQVALAIAGFRFDPSKANGASERTVLTALIDRQLSTMRRAKTRHESRLEQLPTTSEGDETVAADSLSSPGSQDRSALAMDVREAVAQLSPQDRQLCGALAQGRSIDQIARRCGCSWHTVRRQVNRIREHFERMGLRGWVGG